MNIFSKFLQRVRHKPPMTHPTKHSRISPSLTATKIPKAGVPLSPIDDEESSSATEHKDDPTSTHPSSTLDGLTSSKVAQSDIFYRLLTVLRRTLIPLTMTCGIGISHRSSNASHPSVRLVLSVPSVAAIPLSPQVQQASLNMLKTFKRNLFSGCRSRAKI
jgi:hypothetical protein